MDRSAYTHGGVFHVAPGDPQAVMPGGQGRLIVRVRDRSGMPLHRAAVTATINGVAHRQPTDERGRAQLDVPAGVATVGASYAHGVPDRAFPEAPWPTFADDTEPNVAIVAGQVILLTLMPNVSFEPRHTFQWQNRVLRETIYAGRGGVDAGGGADRPPGTRKIRLGQFIHLYEQVLDGRAFGAALSGAGTAREREFDAASHADLMRRLFALFARDAGAVQIPVWLRHMVVQYSGLRYNDQRPPPPASATPAHGHARPADLYTCAHHTYVSPTIYVARLRLIDAQTEVDGLSDALLREIAEEIAYVLETPTPGAPPPPAGSGRGAGRRRAPPSVLSRVLEVVAHNGDLPAQPAVDAARVVAALRDPAASAHRLELVKRVLPALSWVWARELTEDQALGILMTRMALPRPADAGLWKRIVGRTRLHFDTTDPQWLSFEHTDDPNYPAAPAAPWNLVVRQSGYEYVHNFWKSRQAADLMLAMPSSVCNEIVEQLSEVRGIHLTQGGIPRDADVCQLGVNPMAPQPVAPLVAPAAPSPDAGPPAPAEGAPADGAPAEGAPVAPPAPPPTPSSPYRLFRVRSETDVRNLREGAYGFFIGWKPIQSLLLSELGDNAVFQRHLEAMERLALRQPRAQYTPTTPAQLAALNHAIGVASRARPPQTPPTQLTQTEGEASAVDYDPAHHMDPATDFATAADIQRAGQPPGSPSPKTAPFLKYAFESTYVLVRRDQATDPRYNRMLMFGHIFVVVRPAGRDILTFETASPTGISRRGFAELTSPTCYFGTPPNPAATMRPEIYGRPFVPREDQLLNQVDPGRMLFVGTPGQPGPYDAD